MTARLAALLALVFLVAGCAPSPPAPIRPPSPAGPTASPSPSPPPPPQPAVRCGGPSASATAVSPEASDGTSLAGDLLGTGARGVLLVPELGNRSLCGWWVYGARLAGRGYRVLLFDHRCVGYSRCPAQVATRSGLLDDIAAAVIALRTAGATRVVLVGAAQGAAEVLIAGALALPGVTAVAALSPTELGVALAGPPVATALQAAPRLRLPTLVAVAPEDPDSPLVDVATLYGAIPSPAKQFIVVNPQPTTHGWDLVGGAFATSLETFLARYA